MQAELVSLAVVSGSLLVAGLVVVDGVRSSRAGPAQVAAHSQPFSGARFAPLESPGASKWRTDTSRHRIVFIVGFLASSLMVVAGQFGMVDLPVSRAWFALWFAGLLGLTAMYRLADPLSHRSAGPHPNAVSRVRFPAWQVAVAIAIGVASLFIWFNVPDRDKSDRSIDLVVLWLLSIGGLLVLSGAVEGGWLRLSQISVRGFAKFELPVLAAIITIASVTRLYDLSRYARSLSGDEGTFAVTARATTTGSMSNPFSSGPWGYPSLLFIIQGWFIDFFGDSVGNARLLSAFFGIGSVIASYALVRHHFGWHIAAIAGLFVSVFSYHVYWSRDAQDAAAPMFFLPMALLLLDRGLIDGSRGASVAAGLTIAIAQFFHPADRLLIGIAAAYAVYAVLRQAWISGTFSFRAVQATLLNGFWLGAAIVVGHLPLVAYFSQHRLEFWSRTNEVSVFASGWLEREREIAGEGPVAIMLRQFWNALMLPFSSLPHGHYRPGVPLTGWPLAIFVGLGLMIATFWAFRRKYFGISLSFWIITVGLAFTEGPPMTNRYTMAAPLLAIFGAIGIGAITAILIRLIKLRPITVWSLSAVLVATIAIWHLHFYFQHPNQVTLYSDANSQIANGIAREAKALGVGTTVYLSGQPRLSYYGFQTIPYIAPDAIGVDVDTAWTPDRSPPTLTGPTLFVFVPERLNELQVVQSWFPGGVATEHMLPSGSYLYTSYLVTP